MTEGRAALQALIGDLRRTLFTPMNDYTDVSTVRGRFAKACPYLSAWSIERMVEVFADELDALIAESPRLLDSKMQETNEEVGARSSPLTQSELSDLAAEISIMPTDARNDDDLDEPCQVCTKAVANGVWVCDWCLDALFEALRLILAEPHGCPMCDSGKLRNPAKEHWDTCGFAKAKALTVAP